MEDDLLSPAEAARILGLSADMVRLLARSGQLPTAVQSHRGARLFRRGDVEDLAAQRAGRPVHSHAVQFYETEEFLCEVVANFLGEGLRAGAPLLVIATEPHRRAFSARLESDGHDVQGASESGQLALLDARETLAGFMVGGMPDRRRFNAHVGGILGRASAGNRHRPRLYGEMTDLLWRDGKPQAAIKLEKIWNELAAKQPFSLLCTYVMGNFTFGNQADQFDEVCRSHTRVVPTEKFPQHHNLDVRLREIAQLQQRGRALASAQEELSRQNERLTAALRAKDEFLAMLGHELRNPLASIVTALELVRARGSKSREYAVIERKIRHLVRLVDDLMRPLATDTEAAMGTVRSPGERHAPREQAQGHRILVVDDNVEAAEMLVEALGALGYVAQAVHDGPSALQLAPTFKPDAMLVDTGLPVMDGHELAQRLRERPETRSVKLVAITGYGQPADRERARAAGFDEHLVKPVDLREVEDVLRRLL